MAAFLSGRGGMLGCFIGYILAGSQLMCDNLTVPLHHLFNVAKAQRLRRVPTGTHPHHFQRVCNLLSTLRSGPIISACVVVVMQSLSVSPYRDKTGKLDYSPS